MVYQSKYGELVNWDAVNGLGEQEIFGWTEDGDFRIEPYMIYVIMLPSEDAEYAVTEVDCNRGYVPYLEGFEQNYLIQQKVPSPGESIGGVVKESPEAVILNETSLIRGSLVEKRMTPDSDPVPEGSKLVWKVERYDAGARKWYPAEEIAYVINRNDEIVSPETEYTGSDGIIELSRGNYNEGFLAVQFLNDRVYLNRQTGEDGTLRVVEVLKDSDPKWGMLVGYGVANDWEEGYGNASYETASAFVNSNLTAPVEVEKYVEDGESKEFTMILEQRQMDLATNRATYLPYEGVSYIVYSKATHEEEGRGHTNAKGHIKLHDGQYAVLELSTEAVWSVREDLSGRPDYRLASIVPESDPKNVLEAIDTTRALIDRRLDPEEGYILTRYDVQNGVCDAEKNELTVLKEGTVVIPDRIVKDGITYNVMGIGMGAFEGCEDLKGITIPAAVSYVGPGAFYECTALEKVDFKAGDAEITIGNSAFYSCTKLDMELPDRVVSIGYQAFARTGLKRLVIPEKVQYLEEGAFAECTDLRYAEIHGSFGEIRKDMFDGCEKLEELVIDVENIRAEAFSSIQKYSYYDGNRNEMVEVITSIHGCDSLRKLTLTDKVKTIGDFAFASCQNLVEVAGGKSVRSIGKSAFVSCGSLSRFDMGESLRSIGESAFAGCPITQITLPDTLETIGAGAFAGCTELESIAIPDSVVRIGQEAFSGCSKLTSVTLGAGLKTIEETAFAECGSLEEVTIPGGVQKIGDYAFAVCTGLKQVTIQEGVTEISRGMFEGCSALEAVTLPDTLETIREHAFWGCSSLREVRIPENVNYIGEKAFYDCEGLTDVYLQQPYIQIGYWAFGATDPENGWDINHRVCFHVNWSEGAYPEWPYPYWDYDEATGEGTWVEYTNLDGNCFAYWGAADEYDGEDGYVHTVLRIVYLTPEQPNP